MPRNGSNVYSKPPGTTFAAGTTIESAKVNSIVDDLVSDANTARPIVAGGTGATSASAARTALGLAADAGNFGKQGASIASASTTDLSTATGDYVTITGTTTITSFGTATAGVERVVVFAGALTLTHNATSLILPGNANIVTAAGDVAFLKSEGSGNWRCVNFQRQSDNWVDVASATTTDIGAASSQNVRITGTTTITGLGTVAAGTVRRLRFAGALTLTHNGTSLILPGAANITTAAGDVYEFISEGSGNWRCISYQLAAFAPSAISYGAGSVTTTTLAASATITGISSTAKQIVCSVTGIQSTAASNTIIVQLGTGGSLTTSGYSGAGSRAAAAAAATVAQTNGLVIYTNAAAEIVRGILTANLLDESANQWVMTFVGSDVSGALVFTSSSVISLAGTIDRIAFVANSGNIVAGGKINMRQFS